MSKPRLKAPFPAFGGKSRVAGVVWDRLGDVDNYIEPFVFSGAALLARPTPPRVETVNDLNGMVANFWRATAADPDAVVEHADWPVNEADLHARHRWLVLSEEAAEFRRRVRTEPGYYEPRFAGWWCWGACCWIGGGWCVGPDRPDRHRNSQPDLTKPHGKGVHAKGDGPPDGKRPLLGGYENEHGRRTHMGQGVHAIGPGVAGPLADACDVGPPDSGRPQLADAYARGRGVHGNDAAVTCAERREWLRGWFGRLRDRLRTVRVCCGHWDRVCSSPSVTTRLGLTGVFLDPPYPTHAADGTASRAGKLYATDTNRTDLDRLRDEVLAWCRDRGADPRMRVAVCGYDTDGYAELESLGWSCLAWKSSGYGNRRASGRENAARERVWFSPHCLDPARPARGRDQAGRLPLFDLDAAEAAP